MRFFTQYPMIRLAMIASVLACPLALVAVTTNITSVADAGLFEHQPTNNLGGKTYVLAGTIAQGGRCRALFRFNIAAALPGNATVTSASLLLNAPMVKGAGQVFHLHRMLKNWGEGTGFEGGGGAGQGSPANAGEVTWLAPFHPAPLWSSPGGSADVEYVALASDSQLMGGASISYSSAGMAADVQLWRNNPGTNFGWIIIEDNETLLATANHLATRENATLAPVLTIQYSLPAPPNPPNIFGVAPVGNSIRFSFNGQAGNAYTVDARSSMATSWSVLTNVPALAGNTAIHITNAISGNEKYYRVRTP